MARMPETEWVGPHHDNGVMSRIDGIVVHTIVGNPPAHAAHFSTREDGHIFQSRDTQYRSAANLNGNYRMLAIENDDTGDAYGNWDHKDGHQVPGFTDLQCEAIAKILAWGYATHLIPLVLAADSKSTSKGVAYHRQGIDGNFSAYAYPGLVPGGELWSSAKGKVCPGDRRITQLINIILPRARVLAGLDPDMTGVDWNTKYTFGRTDLTTEFGNWIGETNEAAAFASRAAFGYGHADAIAGGSWAGPGLIRGQEELMDELGVLGDKFIAMEEKLNEVNEKMDRVLQQMGGVTYRPVSTGEITTTFEPVPDEGVRAEKGKK